ncbi:hypothetical protein V3C10_16590 [[Clostridium] symbiosum]|uniref:hypothetical protein n=1 Tax=Clostridium symbiosum TaxID=1512 RepID=UPI001D0720BD|nr:hypothetical protein [[Clostridium] symbiosum]MCB6608451.1 hypothetical protein [[Clostridium] symbiosum]MCB6930665.1 hypothetical protein [[Clostridium] symbiosum]
MDNDFLDMILTEYLDTLLKQLNTTSSEEEQERMAEAERLINSLPPKDRDLIEDYCNSSIELLRREEHFLYKSGFMDGVRVMKKIMKL